MLKTRNFFTGLCAIFLMACSAQASTNSLDFTFDPGTGTDQLAEAIAVQPDGKVIITGPFRTYNGVSRDFIARVHNDGTLDTNFVAAANDWIRCVTLQPDGKILIGGNFTMVAGQSRNRVARLNSDGTLDTDFNPGTGVQGAFFSFIEGDIPFLFSIALQTDGKILIGGGFTNYNGTARSCIARLNSNGSLDETFDPGVGAREDWVKNIKVLPSGKIMVVGWFRGFGDQPHHKVVRLNSNGSVDTTFAPVQFHDGSSVYTISVQPDHKYLISGHFTNVNTFQHEGVARLNVNGTVDNTFDAQVGINDFVESILARSNGKVLVAGYFSSVNGEMQPRVAQLNSDGSLDTSFDPVPNAYVLSMALQGHSKLIIVGGFSDVSGVSRTGVARLNLTAPGTPKIFWHNVAGNLATWFFAGTDYVGSAPLQSRGSKWTPAGVADFNNDGHGDLLWVNSSNRNMQIVLMEGTNTVSTNFVHLAPLPASGWKLLAIGDLDSDSSPDLLWGRTNGQMAVWKMNGTSFVESTLFHGGQPVNPKWRLAAIADMDGNSTNDLLWQHAEGQIAVSVLNGMNIESSSVLQGGQKYTAWKIAGTTDFNGDSDTDILFRHTDGRLAVWTMDGTEQAGTYILRDGVSVSPSWRIIGSQ